MPRRTEAATLPGMGTVDLHDDDRRRFVVRRYAYDPVRRERRHQVVAVVDGSRELERLIERGGAELRRRREAGEDVDPREYYSGVVLEPGHLRGQAQARLLRRAVQHGVWPTSALGDLKLPSGVAILQADASRAVAGAD